MKAETLWLAAVLLLAGCGVKGPPKAPLSPGPSAAETSTTAKAPR